MTPLKKLLAVMRRARLLTAVLAVLLASDPARSEINNCECGNGSGGGGGSGADTALSNLATVSINTSLLPQTGVDLGTAAKPFRNLYLFGSGTYGSHSFQITGTPTTNRVVTIQDIPNGILAVRNFDNSFTTNQTFAGQVSIGPVGSSYLTINGAGWPGLMYNKTTTPDTMQIQTGTASNHVILSEGADEGYDFAVPQQTNPTLVVVSANQSANERLGIRHNQVQPEVTDLPTTAANGRPVKFTGGSIVASAATITPTGNAFHVSGATNIDTITVMGSATSITLIFDGILTVGDLTGNINLAGAFVTSANDTLTLVTDGSSWYETARSVN